MRSDKVIPMPGVEKADSKKPKRIPPTQKALDAIPLNSGCWRIEGVLGLYVRARRRTKSFFVQRRFGKRVVHRVLGPLRMAEARRLAPKVWAEMKPRPPATKRLTLEQAWQRYLQEKDLAPTTRKQYAHSLARYFQEFAGRPLHSLADDRATLRSHFLKIKKENGPGIAARLLREFGAVWNYWARIDPTLGPSPTRVVDITKRRSRDWAYAPDELRWLWQQLQAVPRLKRVLWEVLLLTGTRCGSAVALTWNDIDFDAKLIHFRTAKGGRAYSIPACKRLIEILKQWKAECPPSESGWVFPSPSEPSQHVADARVTGHKLGGAHHMRHTYRSALAALGCPPDSARLLMGHSLAGDVSRGYISPHAVLESLRPWAEKVAAHYESILGLEPLP
jgi:integrase